MSLSNTALKAIAERTIVFEFSLRFPDENEDTATRARVVCCPALPASWSNISFQVLDRDQTGEAYWRDAGNYIPFAVMEACFRRLTAAPDFVPPRGRHRTNEHGVQFYDLGCLVTEVGQMSDDENGPRRTS